MPTLYLIDGYAQFFRAYHAIRAPMTSPVTKEPTNMTFGFVGMLLKLLRGEEPRMGGPPDYLAVAIDVSGDKETFRSELYPDYKAHRPPPPEDLFPQVDRCLAILRTLGVPVVGVEGFEADDAIATIVHRLRASHPDLRIRIISKDKDLKQLLSGAGKTERVALYDIHHDTLIDEAALRESTGLTPAQVVDMLALMGDTVDNVPGVPGIGEKTAAQLLAQYGTLDDLVARAGEIKGKRGEAIRAAVGQFPLARSLVELRRDAPVDLDLEAARVERIHLGALLPILRELGFNRYQDEVRALLGDAGAPPMPAPSPRPSAPPGGLFDAPTEAAPARRIDGDYRCIRTREELAAVVELCRRAPVLALDTETTSLMPLSCKLCGVSLSIRPGEGWYIPVRSPEPDTHLDERVALAALRPLLEDPTLPKCGHNLKYDILVLRASGVEVRGLTTEGGCDSMVASYLIDAGRSSHGLDSLAQALLQRSNIPISDLIGSGKGQRTFDTAPLALATAYAAEDADVSLQLRNLMLPQLRALGLADRLWAAVELPLVEVLAELEWNGVRVDPSLLEAQRLRLVDRIDALRRDIIDEAMTRVGRGFDPDSPKQLAAILFNRPDAAEPGFGLPVGRKNKTGYSTDAEVLEKLAEDAGVSTRIPALILDYRQLSKLVSTYLLALRDAIHPRTGRVHASFHQTVAATGRLASSDPNLQNIPIRTDVGREIRRAFIADPGNVLISADYSQIELRLLAHLSKDPGLIQAFHEGQDIHTAVAAQVHGVRIEDVTREQRSGAKMVNFGIVYGITAFGLARRLGIPNADAARIIDDYKRRFAGISTFLEECIAQARRFGYVSTILGRRRPIEGIEDANPSRRALAERTAINSVVQGSAADLIKIAMVDLHRRLSPHAGHWRSGAAPEVAGVRMLLQIHDELVFEASEAAAPRARDLIEDRMQRAMTVDVPLVVDSAVSKDWFEEG